MKVALISLAVLTVVSLLAWVVRDMWRDWKLHAANEQALRDRFHGP